MENNKLNFEHFTEMFKHDYTSEQLKYLFGKLRTMDPQLRRDFLKWIFTGNYPETEIENVTVPLLVEKAGFKPINAFLIMDWLKKEPQTAKYMLTRRTAPRAIDPLAQEEAEEYLKNHPAEQLEPDPDTSGKIE